MNQSTLKDVVHRPPHIARRGGGVFLFEVRCLFFFPALRHPLGLAIYSLQLSRAPHLTSLNLPVYPPA